MLGQDESDLTSGIDTGASEPLGPINDISTLDLYGAALPYDQSTLDQESQQALYQAIADVDSQVSTSDLTPDSAAQQISQLTAQAGSGISGNVPEPSFLSKILGIISPAPSSATPTVIPYTAAQAGVAGGSTFLILAGIGILALFAITAGKRR